MTQTSDNSDKAREARRNLTGLSRLGITPEPRDDGVPPSCPAGILPAQDGEGDSTFSSGQANGTFNTGETPASRETPATPHVLEACGLAFSYRPDRPVLRGVSFTASAGRLLCVLGPNGSGKTTLLRCLLGQFKPTGGQLKLDGRDVGKFSARGLAQLLAYVPQFPQSAFAFTVQELVLMGRFAHTGVMGLTTEQDLAVAKLAMQMTHCLDLADRTLEELSGGEAQCVMIARALAQQPSLMLLDEPTSHLDLRNQLLIYQMMTRLAHDWNMAVLCVAHDINVAAQHADELLLMRQGEIIAQGPPADVMRQDILETLYGVAVELIDTGRGVPLVMARM
ncbi:MAG: ABC transporter ATP-binding protein [Phycisphaerae bacterium]|nr:ABC transporter ATP-binding protein [Phycisphaerae bacterium]